MKIPLRVCFKRELESNPGSLTGTPVPRVCKMLACFIGMHVRFVGVYRILKYITWKICMKK